jgi:predicted nucleic acid-binding protein
MITLDTNIISELMKISPSDKVVSWIDQQNSEGLCITSITIAEISYGIQALKDTRRKQRLDTAFQSLLVDGFQFRILDFNATSAELYGKIMAQRRSIGKPMSICDGQIAAITLNHNYTLATRNTNDFKNCDIELINPFK